MQQLRDELSSYEDEVARLIDRAQDVVPLRARSERKRGPLDAIAVCEFQSKEVRRLFESLSFKWHNSPLH